MTYLEILCIQIEESTGYAYTENDNRNRSQVNRHKIMDTLIQTVVESWDIL